MSAPLDGVNLIPQDISFNDSILTRFQTLDSNITKINDRLEEVVKNLYRVIIMLENKQQNRVEEKPITPFFRRSFKKMIYDSGCKASDTSKGILLLLLKISLLPLKPITIPVNWYFSDCRQTSK